MTSTIKLAAQERKPGVLELKRLRTLHKIPAVVYGKGFKTRSISVDESDFKSAYTQVGQSSLIELVIGDQTVKTLIHDLQIQPASQKISHADFYKVDLTEKIEADIPIKTVGTAPVVKELQGTLVIGKDHLKVKALPQDLIHDIEVDVSALKAFEDTIKVKDILLPSTFELLDDPQDVVILVHQPRSEEELEALDEKPVEADVESVEIESKSREEDQPTPTQEPGSDDSDSPSD